MQPCPKIPKHFTFTTSRTRKEGRFAIVTNVGYGMRWTRAAHETNVPTADGEVVWSWHLDADAKLATMLAHRGQRR